MRQETRDLAREDRTTTLHELRQVIGLLIATDQLPLTSVASFESEGSRSEDKGIEIWTEADLDRLRAADIEYLTNVILGRSPRFN
jgi:hypothetical protein